MTAKRAPKLPRAPRPLSKRKPPQRLLRELNDNHWVFIVRYCVHMNQARAYREAYGADIKRPDVLGSKLFGQPLVRKEIDKRMSKIIEHYADTPNKTVAELSRIAYSNMQDLHDDDGKLLEKKDIPRHVFGAVRKIEYDDKGNVSKIELYDKLGAISKLGTYEGIFTERVEVVSGEEMAKRIKEARERSLRRGQQ